MGYIYIRLNESYDTYKACKLGKTINIIDRESTYMTGEIKKGYFICIYELNNIDVIEKLLQIYFKKYHVIYDGGKEFYDNIIIDLIEEFFIINKIKYKKLTNEEINKLSRIIRIKNIYKKINKNKLIKQLKNIFSPRIDQREIINISIDYFKNNNKGLLIIPCGVGKTLISLWITINLNYSKIIIGVPNKLLLIQWKNIIQKLYNKNINILLVYDNITINNIIHFLQNNKKCIVITSYASSYKMVIATKKLNYIFDMKINDETHHLTGLNLLDNKNFIQMLNIPSLKQLSLTATMKIINNNNTLITNDNIDYFGEIIIKKSLLWAINNNLICDYVLQIIMSNTNNTNRLYLSAYLALKSIFINDSHHILIYANNKNNSIQIIKYIEELLINQYFIFNNNDLFYSSYHSEIKINEQINIIKNYKKAKNAIISCVYCLSEGYDDPNIDCVIFAENMTSNIRIVQSALRASRKNINEPNKITKIILPIINNNEWINKDNEDFKNIKEIIYQMGLEDETIYQKIKFQSIIINKTLINNNQNKFIDNDYLIEQLQLRTIKRNDFITYESTKKILANKNFMNKQDYYNYCDIDKRLPKNPEQFFNKNFINWIDYLNIPKKYYDFNICQLKIKEYSYLLNNNGINDIYNICYQLCQIDNLFPPFGLWTDYYNVKNLNEIIIISMDKKKKIKKICL